MNKTLILAAMIAIISTSALAQTTTTNCRHSYYSGVTCTTRTFEPQRPPEPLTPSQRAAVEAERDAELQKWTAYCKPDIVQDQYGVPRYRYVHTGCDLGKSED